MLLSHLSLMQLKALEKTSKSTLTQDYCVNMFFISSRMNFDPEICFCFVNIVTFADWEQLCGLWRTGPREVLRGRVDRRGQVLAASTTRVAQLETSWIMNRVQRQRQERPHRTTRVYFISHNNDWLIVQYHNQRYIYIDLLYSNVIINIMSVHGLIIW